MPPEMAPPAPHLSPRVLIIEDDDSIAMALAFVISRQGLLCDRLPARAEAMDDALAALREARPDLLVVDLTPDALALCHALRTDPALSGTRILAMAARGSAHDLRRVQALGADGQITKPLDPAALRAELRRLFPTA